MELARHGWAAVLAVGVVGVDKCLQALSVACTEVLAESGGGKKVVAAVRKMRVRVVLKRQPDEGSGKAVSGHRMYELNAGTPLARPSQQAAERGGHHFAVEAKNPREGTRTGFVFESWLCDVEAFAGV